MEPPNKNFEDSCAAGKAAYGGSQEASEGNNCGCPCNHHGQLPKHPGEVRIKLKSVQPSSCLSKCLEADFTHLNTVNFEEWILGDNNHNKPLDKVTWKLLGEVHLFSEAPVIFTI